MTEPEVVLWNYLKDKQLGYKFRRQTSVGKYIVDFYCPIKKLVIEIDGIQHLENEKYDNIRTQYLNSLDIKVLRIWNGELYENINGVIEEIIQELKSR